MVKETVAKKGSWGCLGALVGGLVLVAVGLSGLNYGVSNKVKTISGGQYSRVYSWSLVDLPYGRTSFEEQGNCLTLRRTPPFFVGDFYQEKQCHGREGSRTYNDQIHRFEREFKDEF